MSDNTIINTNSDRAKWWLGTFVLFIALIIEVYFLMYDVPIFQRYFSAVKILPSDLESIAQLMSKTNVVRVQASGDLVWDETQNNQMLHRQDSILTLERSRAEVAFLDGTGLVIEENSLVQLQRSPENESMGAKRIVIKLLHGTIRKAKPRGERIAPLAQTARFSPELNIQVGEIVAKITPESELTVKADPEASGKAKITVEKGKVELVTPQGDLSINKGEEAVISKDVNSKSKIVTRQITFALIEPMGGESIEAEADPLIQFQWKVNGASTGGSSLELEASTDPEFKTDLHHLRIGSTEPPLELIQTKISLPLRTKPTLWYWRVHTNNKTPLMSEVSRFWIQHKHLSAAPIPLMKEGYQSVIEPNKAPPPPAKIFAPEIERLPKKKGRH